VTRFEKDTLSFLQQHVSATRAGRAAQFA